MPEGMREHPTAIDASCQSPNQPKRSIATLDEALGFLSFLLEYRQSIRGCFGVLISDLTIATGRKRDRKRKGGGPLRSLPGLPPGPCHVFCQPPPGPAFCAFSA